jgi:cbb3-type cytochrome oxidase maturation protein
VTILYLLMPLAVIVASGFLAAFIWSVRSGQLDDTETPAVRILKDD